MKRKMALLTVLLVLCACAGIQPPLPESSAADVPAPSAFEPPAASLEFEGVQLHFLKPDRPYDVLGITAFREGYAVIYQQEMPDTFNKIYSRDDVFYNISTQLFSTGGKYLTTVDSLRHNLDRLSAPLQRLAPQADTITFEVWDENQAGKTEATCFMLALTGQGTQALGYNPNKERYRQLTFTELISDGTAQLQYANDYDYEHDQSLLRFRLVLQEGAALEQVVPDFDASFFNALYDTAYGVDTEDSQNDQQNPLDVLTASLDAQSKTATLSNGKICCTLNFNSENSGSRITRSYTDAMLEAQYAASPDGARQLYTADVRSYFESPGGCDYVVRGPEGIAFLYAGSALDQLYFLDNDRIFVNTFDTLRFYDAASGAVLSPGPQFDFGTQQNPSNKSTPGMVRIVAGTAVDMANRVLLVAHRPYTFGSGVLWRGTAQQTTALPVTLTVLDWDGRAIGEYNTGMTMRAFAKFSINVLSVKINGDGTADLSYQDEAPVRVRYQPEAEQDIPIEAAEVLL